MRTQRPAGLIVPIALGLLVIILGIAVFVMARTRAGEAARLGKLEAENRALRTRSDALAREADALRHGIPVPPTPLAPAPDRGDRNASAQSMEQAKLLIQFREQLATANRTVESLQVRIQEQQYAIEKANEDNKRLATSETDLKDKLTTSRRVVDAVQAELKGRDERLLELDSTNRRLREENRTSADKTGKLAHSMQELEDINRRREVLLTGVLRRYREMTDRYRAAAARLDRDNTAAAGPELSGLQNTVSLTEEDLRQLNALNAQATRLRQTITGK